MFTAGAPTLNPERTIMAAKRKAKKKPARRLPPRHKSGPKKGQFKKRS